MTWCIDRCALMAVRCFLFFSLLCGVLCCVIVVRGLLFDGCCLVFVVCCVLLVVCCLLLVVGCLLFVECLVFVGCRLSLFVMC